MLLRRSKGRELRLFFATDLHGSTLAFRKFLSAPSFYKVDVLVLGGDLTGKRLVPVAGTPADELRERAESEGAYLWEADRDAVERVRSDEELEREVLTRLSCDRLRSWLARAEEVLASTGTDCYAIAGNDDGDEFVEILASHPGPRVRFCEDRMIELDGDYQIGGLGWSNPTPWKTPREATEDELADRLERLRADIRDPERAILDLHPPPHGTLDVCPELDASFDPPRQVLRGGQPVLASVGSVAVRDFLLDVQPLVALCGHVHEAHGAQKLRRTTIVNPGSEYGEGILRGAIVQIGERGVRNYQLTSG